MAATPLEFCKEAAPMAELKHHSCCLGCRNCARATAAHSKTGSQAGHTMWMCHARASGTCLKARSPSKSQARDSSSSSEANRQQQRALGPCFLDTSSALDAYVYVSAGVSEGRPKHVLMGANDDRIWFATNETQHPPPWIELHMPANVQLLSLREYSFHHGHSRPGYYR